MCDLLVLVGRIAFACKDTNGNDISPEHGAAVSVRADVLDKYDFPVHEMDWHLHNWMKNVDGIWEVIIGTKFAVDNKDLLLFAVVGTKDFECMAQPKTDNAPWYWNGILLSPDKLREAMSAFKDLRAQLKM